MNSHPTAATPARHGALTITLHWLSALAVLVAFSVAWTRASLDEPHPRAILMLVHQCAGLLVFALLLPRVAARIAGWRRAVAPGLPRAMRIAALVTHGALYLALLAMPLLGWALTNAHGHDVHLPGLPALPEIAAADPDLADTLESWHIGLAWVLGAVVVAHVGAALFHHFVRKDAVLRSMLPEREPSRPRLQPRRRSSPQTGSSSSV